MTHNNLYDTVLSPRVRDEPIERSEHALAAVEQALATLGDGFEFHGTGLGGREPGICLEERFVGETLVHPEVALAPRPVERGVGVDAGPRTSAVVSRVRRRSGVISRPTS